jgi:hypothetical protein
MKMYIYPQSTHFCFYSPVSFHSFIPISLPCVLLLAPPLAPFLTFSPHTSPPHPPPPFSSRQFCRLFIRRVGLRLAASMQSDLMTLIVTFTADKKM